jgi:hypothetical protein
LAVHTEDLADGSYVSAAAPVTPRSPPLGGTLTCSPPR